MGTEVAGLLDSLFRDCGCIYSFLSFVDIFNKVFGNSKWCCILFHQPGPVGSCVKGRAPKHNLLPKKSLFNWDYSSCEVPTAALLLFKDE